MSANPESLRLERVFSVSAEQLFDAWTEAKLIQSWFGPVGFVVTRSDINPVRGGKYSITIQAPDGREIHHYGEYLEVNRPLTLVFSWMLDNQDCEGSQGQCETTIVNLSLEPLSPTQTKLVLVHEQLPNKEAYDGHQFGWLSSLDSLAQFLGNR